MATCETCKHHDGQNPTFPTYYLGRYEGWVPTTVPEFRCLRHPGTTHYRGDYCPDHSDNFREQSKNVRS